MGKSVKIAWLVCLGPLMEQSNKFKVKYRNSKIQRGCYQKVLQVSWTFDENIGIVSLRGRRVNHRRQRLPPIERQLIRLNMT